MKTSFDLRKEIESEHSKRNTERVARWIGHNKKRFGQLMDLFLAGEPLVAQRSAWIVSCCAEEHPDLVKPWISKLVRRISERGVHDAVKRNGVRVLQFVDIPKTIQGRVADLCFGFLRSVDAPIAVKAFSMTVLTNIAAEEPDLKHEIALILEEMLPYGSAGIQSRAKKILKTISFNR